MEHPEEGLPPGVTPPTCLQCGKSIGRPKRSTVEEWLNRRFCKGSCSGRWLKAQRARIEAGQETRVWDPPPILFYAERKADISACRKCKGASLYDAKVGVGCRTCGTVMLTRDGDWESESRSAQIWLDPYR